jgi:hypothetical protein
LGSYDPATVAHEFAHHLGFYKEYYGKGHSGTTMNFNMHFRTGFNQRMLKGNEISLLFLNLDEEMKEIIAEKAMEKLGVKEYHVSYKAETEILKRIISILSMRGVDNPFSLFLKSDRNGWSKELKGTLVQAFGKYALVLLNFNYKFLKNKDQRIIDKYTSLLRDFFSYATTQLTQEEKRQKGEVLMEFLRSTQFK